MHRRVGQGLFAILCELLGTLLLTIGIKAINKSIEHAADIYWSDGLFVAGILMAVVSLGFIAAGIMNLLEALVWKGAALPYRMRDDF